MAITVVSQKTVAWARALASQAVDLSDLTMAAGDLLVLVVGVSITQSDRQIEPPSSGADAWTRIHATLYQDDTNDINLSSWYRVAPSTAPSSVTITSANPSSTTTGSTTITVLVLRGVDTSTPLDVAPTTAGDVNSAHANPPAITPVTAGSLILLAGVCGHGAATNPTLEAGADVTQISTIQGYAGQTQQAITTIATKTNWVSGAFDAAAWSYKVNGTVTANTQGSWGAAAIAFRPAASGGGNITGTLAKALSAPALVGAGKARVAAALTKTLAAPVLGGATGIAAVRGALGTVGGTVSFSSSGSGTQGIPAAHGILTGTVLPGISLSGSAVAAAAGGLSKTLPNTGVSAYGAASIQGAASLLVPFSGSGEGIYGALPAYGIGLGSGFALDSLLATGSAPAAGTVSGTGLVAFQAELSSATGTAPVSCALEAVFGISFASSATVVTITHDGVLEPGISLDFDLAAEGTVTGEGIPVAEGMVDVALVLGVQLSATGAVLITGQGAGLITVVLGLGAGLRVPEAVPKIIVQSGVWLDRTAEATFINATQIGLWQTREGSGAWA